MAVLRQPRQGPRLARAPGGRRVTTARVPAPRGGRRAGRPGANAELPRVRRPPADAPGARTTARSRSRCPLGRGRPRTVRIHDGQARPRRVDGRSGPAVSAAARERASPRAFVTCSAWTPTSRASTRWRPRIPTSSWATAGAGRMVQSPTVFEDVVKTICTTNCAWSATVRMVARDRRAPRRAGARCSGRRAARPAFPTPAAMAEAGEAFYRDVARAGYRGAYLVSPRALGRRRRQLDLEALATRDRRGAPGRRARGAARAPGVGPYAAAHIMMTVGRYHRLILDSWTRPTYARIVGRKAVKDAAIERRFRRYGRTRASRSGCS